MYDDINFLEYIYQSAKIGQEIIGRIIKQNKEKSTLDEVLKEQLNYYRKISSSAKLMLERRKKQVKDISVLTKMATYMSVKINVSEESDTEEILNILIQESNIRVIDIRKKLKESKIKSKSIINLADRFIIFEEENIYKLKKHSEIEKDLHNW